MSPRAITGDRLQYGTLVPITAGHLCRNRAACRSRLAIWHIQTCFENHSACRLINLLPYTWLSSNPRRFVWGLRRAAQHLTNAWGRLSRAQRSITAASRFQRSLGLDNPSLEAARNVLSALHSGRAAASSFLTVLQVGASGSSCPLNDAHLSHVLLAF